ncbi:MAG: hypothetical protein KTR17_01445 [Cellvibrionaceae bacterium]|nr:hypothetical protein [Cellvibrionaceae bacterium]
MKKNLFCYVLLPVLSSYSFAQQNLVKEEPMASTAALSDEVTSEPAVPIAQGIRYSCLSAGNVRRIEVEYEAVDSSLPCSVNYYKDNESPGENVTLWRAEKAEGFCESKAAEFVDKLQNFGWECTES